MREKRKYLKITVPPLPGLPHVPINPSSSLSISPSTTNSSCSSSSASEIEALSDLKRLSFIGRGGAGKVYKVSHKQNGSVYALKVVHCSEEAAREAEILRKIDSWEYIVRCAGIFDGEGGLCFVMEYMDAGSLYDVICNKKRLSEEMISGITVRVLKGLQYLHGLQLVHRDMKPSNVLINLSGKVKISDLGAATRARTTKECDCGRSFSRGTWAYMSPERMDPETWNYGGDGYAGDVWGVGVVAMECYMGRFPLVEPGEEMDWVAMMWAVCYADIIDVESLVGMASTEFLSFCRRCLERDWRKRGTVEELLLHPFIIKYSIDDVRLIQLLLT